MPARASAGPANGVVRLLTCRASRLAPLLAVPMLLPGGAGAQEGPTLHLVHDVEASELVIEIRGVDLPARVGHDQVRQPAAQTAEIPVDGWIHGYRVELVDARGRSVPREVLHHVNVIVPEQRELFSHIMLRIAAAGQETQPAILPRLLGYPIHQGQRLLVTAAFHNPTAEAYADAVLRVRMPYTPADAWLAPISIYPLYLDVMPPAGGHAYDLPPGRSAKSWEGKPAISGRILALGGHLHRYGVVLRLEDVTEGEVLWAAEPILDETGDVVGMPMKRFLWSLGVPIHADHVYRLTAIYENPTGKTIPNGAMGALGGVFLPARGAVWPAVDRSHPEYTLDVKTVTEGAYGHGGHGGAPRAPHPTSPGTVARSRPPAASSAAPKRPSPCSRCSWGR